MANIKEIKSKTLSTIDAGLSILNKFPVLENSNTELSFNTSTNPFTFLMDLLKTTSGYNKTIQIIAKFISWELPIIEAAVKALLITKLKEIVSCSVNPFFTEEILRDGVVFNVEEIDIADVLKYSPLDKMVGQYFYFGTEEVKMPDDLVTCDDMDAFIWFIINKANRRYSWKPKKNRHDDEFRQNYDNLQKLKKEDGIITLEYYERAQNLKDAYGNDYNIQTPFNNCLHVFIGDVREKEEQITNLIQNENNLYKEDDNIKLFTNKIENKQFKIDTLQEEKANLEKLLEEEVIKEDEFKTEYQKINNKISLIQRDIDDLINLRDKAYAAKRRLQYTIASIKTQIRESANTYFPFLTPNKNRNYYYGKSLIEWNIDYIMSLTLFDSKSVIARLLDAFTSVLTIDLSLTYKQQLIKNEVKKMVRMITESDDIVVSDCFFTFSNDDYDAMSRQAELKKAGLLTIDGDETSAVKITSENIFEKLNELNKSTSKEEIQTVIEGTITELTKELSNVTYEMNDKANFGIQMNIIENLLNNLAYVLVCSILSPKVYLLLLVNLKIIGRQTNFNLEGFIGQYKQLIADLIRSIRDQLLEYLLREIMIIIGDLVKEITIKLSVEQARYYADLIKKLIDCFRKHSKEFNFNIDNVNYADIYEDMEEPKNNEC